jgi:hypothetical protein
VIFAPAAKLVVGGGFSLVWAHIDGTTVSDMRHVWTLIAAVVIAPLAWVLLAYGQDRSLQAFLNEEAAGAFRDGDFIRPALCLGAAGLLLALLGIRRLSPAGAVLTGLAYTGAYLAMLLKPHTVLDLLPGRISLAGREADLATPLRTGTAMVAGVVLLLVVAFAGRRRRADDTREETADRGRLDFGDARPLGADGLGFGQAPAFGELIGAAHRDADADPDGEHGWGVPVTPGRPNQRADDAPMLAAQRWGRWEEMARETGPESRRWPTTR